MGVLVLAALISSAQSPGLSCRAMAVARRAGEIVRVVDTVPEVCREASRIQPLRYDVRRREALAAVDLEAGAYLGHVWFAPPVAVTAGDRVRISAKLGHVTLSREAVALQSARPGQPYFVRSDEGQIFVAPAAGGTQ